MDFTLLSTAVILVSLKALPRHCYLVSRGSFSALHGNPIVCQQYRDVDPHGADPHGSDPHDENHDMGLKANAMEDKRTATDNVYGTKDIGINSQHPLDNFPGQPGF